MNIRVCLIHTIISPYRLAIFEELSKTVNLEVVFCKAITKNRVWSYNPDKYDFKYSILRGFSIGPIIFNINSLKKLWKSDFDIVIISNEPEVAPTALAAFVVAKLRRKKILGWSQAFDDNIYFFPKLAYSESGINRILREMLSIPVMLYRRFYCCFPDHYIVLGRRAQKFLETHGIAEKDITDVHQVIPPELLPEPRIKQKRTGYTFLYIGYFNEGKGLNYLIDVFKRITDKKARLIIAGSGKLELELREWASDDSRISFSGYVEGISKANLYTQCDIFVLPTLNDSWGLVINEAIHYGLAVVCSDAAAAVEIIDEKTGKIFPSGDTDKLYRAMTKLINDQAKLKEIQVHNYHKSSVSDVRYESNNFFQAIRRTTQ